MSAAAAFFVVAATVPAFIVGLVAGRRWRRGAVGNAVLLAFGIPIAAWAVALLAVRGGEGLGELAIVGGSISLACSLLGAFWTAARETSWGGD